MQPAYQTVPLDSDSTELYGITAITHGKGAKAWRVTLFRDGRKVIDKEFPHLTHGGEASALQKAQACRDETMLKHPPRHSREVRQKVRTTNTSGHPGVTRYRMGRYWYWVAQTKRRDGKPIKKSFRIDLYGEQEAKALAIAERERQLEEIDHRVFRSARGEQLYDRLVSNARARTS